jgi:hypothetical protein
MKSINKFHLPKDLSSDQEIQEYYQNQKLTISQIEEYYKTNCYEDFEHPILRLKYIC